MLVENRRTPKDVLLELPAPQIRCDIGQHRVEIDVSPALRVLHMILLGDRLQRNRLQTNGALCWERRSPAPARVHRAPAANSDPILPESAETSHYQRAARWSSACPPLH